MLEREQDVGTMERAQTVSTTLLFEPEGREAEVPVGLPLALAAAKAGVSIEQPCGGLGLCGQCRVQFLRDAPPPCAEERRWLTEKELREGWRLACRHRVEGPAAIVVPDRSRSRIQRILTRGEERAVALEPLARKVFLRLPRPSLGDDRGDWERLRDALEAQGILLDGSLDVHLLVSLPERLREAKFQVTCVLCGGEVVVIEPGDTRQALYGIAVDVGTTTLVVYLLDLTTGQELGVAAGMNPQVAYGDDLIARIHHAGTPQGRRELQRAVMEGLNRLIQEASEQAGVSRQQIYVGTFVGNTCMTHLLLGLDVTPLGQMPYVPVVRGEVITSARRLGLHIMPDARIHILPAIGGFVGADTVGVMLSHLWEEESGPRLAVDIGTNGEMVLQKGRQRWACSAAAGPAFEGGRIRYGMRGAPGAIASVWIDEDVHYATIESRPPQGICGSGLLDAVAEMLKVGLLDETGRMVPPGEEEALPPALRRRLRGQGREREFLLVPASESALGEDIVLTQGDVREFQLAKGSICAAISTLLRLAELEPEEVEHVYLAGAFGTFLNVESALRVGLLPPFPRERIEAVGNAAAVGAKLALLSRSEWERARRLAASVEHLTLSQHPDYQALFMEKMVFPGSMG